MVTNVVYYLFSHNGTQNTLLQEKGTSAKELRWFIVIKFDKIVEIKEEHFDFD